MASKTKLNDNNLEDEMSILTLLKKTPLQPIDNSRAGMVYNCKFVPTRLPSMDHLFSLVWDLFNLFEDLGTQGSTNMSNTFNSSTCKSCLPTLVIIVLHLPKVKEK
ncbi:hypothetical protein PPL_09418 [Heterostelium album PN500]|uniref:Uncharacterized protein n=1 Tax=Heterostelium pallidum (strain ATCC 26659 / Pp 5 / PN500) TaxID=670386 RepID=D3BPF0_HETP5|nr:hypothetical protein PPL_09418 [Heterostelium album PN500]EFA76668.1 hypothetical protein PPL_09418 [Heterostelium album PN500]|eukprot:XP_020428800.1 hypothetical protein PPL_09418 [Heterostelium album PN500]